MTDDPTTPSKHFTIADFEDAGVDLVLANDIECDYKVIWDALRLAAEDAAMEGYVRRSSVLLLLADVCSMRLLPENLRMPFNPFAVIDDWRSAIPEDFGADAVAFFSEVLDHVRHPALRARLADLAWFREPPRGSGLAVTAIDAYRALPLDENTWLRGVDNCWRRALQLATKLGGAGRARAEEIEDALLASFDAADPAADRSAIWFSEPLIQRPLSSARRTGIAEKLERAGRRCADGGRHRDARDFWGWSARWFVKAGQKEASYRVMVAIAEAWASEALARESMRPPASSAAASAYENAIQVYRSIPVKGRAPYDGDARVAHLRARLKAAGERAVGEMEVISTPPQDITALVEKSRAQVMGKPPMDAMHGLAALFNGPVEAAVRQGSEHLLAGSIAAGWIGTRRMTRDGRLAAVAPPYYGSPEARAARIQAQMVRDFEITMSLVVSGQVLPALQVMMLEHRLDERIFVALARESPLIPPSRENLFGKGLYAGYCGDFDAAVHFLVPQMENLVRYHLKEAGALTTNLSKEGIDNENGMSALVKLPEMRLVFGDDLTFELIAVFCDPMGPNLRNELAHGLLADGDAHSVAGIYAWWLAFRLTFGQFWNARRPDVDAAEPAADGATDETPVPPAISGI